MNFNRNKQSTKKDEPKTKKKITRRQIVNSICIVFLSSTLIVSLVGFVMLQDILNNKSLISGIDGLTSENSSRIFAADGSLITTLSGDSGVRENTTYDKIPQVVIDAFLSIEDSRFFKHNGFDLARFIKAGFENVKSGGFDQGGSTLTMQLIDVSSGANALQQTTTQKLEQKVQEIFKSMEIETDLSKEKIMENYLNKINFGGVARGIQKGAQFYFDKSVEQLNLNEAAFLAGVINAPANNNPYFPTSFDEEGAVKMDYYANATERRNETLTLMLRHGYITQMEYDLTKTTELAFQLGGAKTFDSERNQAYVDAAIIEAIDKTASNPYDTPMDIYTNMIPAAQELADQLSDNTVPGLDVPYLNDRFQSAFTSMNNQTGAIVAVGQGRNYVSGPAAKLRATDPGNMKQFGSTAKPLTAYIPSFDNLGISTEHVYEDGPKAYGTGVMPNYSQSYQGDVSIREAVGKSLNTTAYQAINEVINTVGEDVIIDTLNKMGFDRVTKENFNSQFSVGGAAFEGTPTELAGAYSVLANNGDYIKPYMVSKVVFQDKGKDDYVASQEKQKATLEESAYLMSTLLKDAVDGTQYGTLVEKIKIPGVPVYGKSGTTDWGDSGVQFGYEKNIAKDKWMAGYTSQYTVACWAGYDGGVKGEDNFLKNQQEVLANVEGVIVKAMLEKLSEGQDVQAIARPAGVVEISHIQGLFPYATALEGGQMVTGLINKKFAGNLKTISPDALSTPTSFDVTSTNGVLNLSIAPYPDATKLVASGGRKIMTANGVSVEGLQMFSKSALFGVVDYNYEIFVNGTSVAVEKFGEAPTVTRALDAKSTDEIKVCGWYGYSIAGTKSDNVCKTVAGSSGEKTSLVGSDFNALFEGGTFAETKAKVDTFMATKLMGISYRIEENKLLLQGRLDPLSTIKTGIEVSTAGGEYVIIIGSKPNTRSH